MSQENVEAFKRISAANNRRDVEALLEELDADVEWHSAVLRSLTGEGTVGDRIVAVGRWITRGDESGVETTPPLAYRS